MATRGTVAKEVVAQKIIKAFGDDYVATVDKKIYVTAMENGELVQVAISMTCPKTLVSPTDKESKSSDYLDWSSDEQNPNPVEISPEDDAKVRELMQKLGISD